MSSYSESERLTSISPPFYSWIGSVHTHTIVFGAFTSQTWPQSRKIEIVLSCPAVLWRPCLGEAVRARELTPTKRLAAALANSCAISSWEMDGNGIQTNKITGWFRCQVILTSPDLHSLHWFCIVHAFRLITSETQGTTSSMLQFGACVRKTPLSPCDVLRVVMEQNLGRLDHLWKTSNA